MRIRTLAVVALMGFGLSGCSLWTKSDKAAQTTHSDTSLRTTPQQAYQFNDQAYTVDIHDAASNYNGYSQSAGYSQFAGYQVELYDTRPSYAAAAFIDPRQSEFVMLNGESEPADWQNCETSNSGYLYMSEYDFMLDPGFEVCMRNKGYVLTTEYGAGAKRTLSAQTAGLRESFAQPAPRSSYPAFFP
jgi:hypothetical protein